MKHQLKEVPTKQARKEALYLDIFNAANEAGNKAAAAANPTPMIVSQHKNMADDNSPIEKQWFVSEGVCGFAWVVIKPGTHSFAKWLQKTGRGRKDYYGGISVSDHLMTQSMERKMAWTHAFCKVLHEVFGDQFSIYPQSRMD